MRVASFMLASVIVLGMCSCLKNPPAALSTLNLKGEAAKSSAANVKIDFDTQIKPILQQRCQPCHFSGGVMYQRLPFDRAQTIKTLGTKLFTRIKDEKEQRLIRDFLEQVKD